MAEDVNKPQRPEHAVGCPGYVNSSKSGYCDCYAQEKIPVYDQCMAYHRQATKELLESFKQILKSIPVGCKGDYFPNVARAKERAYAELAKLEDDA